MISKNYQTENAMNIVIAGLGYVGLSLACLLSKRHHVRAIDIDPDKVNAINNWKSPIADSEISMYLATHPDNLSAAISSEEAYLGCDLVIIATPTDYDEHSHAFNTSSVEAVLDTLERIKSSARVVIKSTIPVGYTDAMSLKYPDLTLMFSPEFLREGHALHDNLYPSRIIVGHSLDSEAPAKQFAMLLRESSENQDAPILITGTNEAEAIKLFANTYLALRVSYFNELDTYAESKDLNTKEIIEGVCLDPRIGNHYNNPSFGYGGYCLPKDSKQLLANYENVPQDLIRAIVDSNSTRIRYIADEIIQRQPNVVGAYRVAMKQGSDNYRQSATLKVLDILRSQGVQSIIFEPDCQMDAINGFAVERDLDTFKESCDLIIANRYSEDLEDAAEKVYTRDLWQRD